SLKLNQKIALGQWARPELKGLFVDQKVTNLENQGGTVVPDGSITGSCGTTCKPDIFHISPNGQVEFIEVKTGNAGLSENQAKVFRQIGVDASGRPQYIIPPDAVPSGDLMNELKMKPGQTLAEAGYIHGIPVKIQREPGG
ncbi:hypothetical protein, partial [Rheinheimera tangshanensis]|uniref:hypothetical protein n=1 Tax=Rheinheimera tangshanensis TaxID=400153 RepID=UPI001C86B955